MDKTGVSSALGAMQQKYSNVYSQKTPLSKRRCGGNFLSIEKLLEFFYTKIRFKRVFFYGTALYQQKRPRRRYHNLLPQKKNPVAIIS